MGAKVTVYLDSQDFSRFSPSHSDYASMLATRKELLRLKESGIATFVFSDIHVFEAMPTHPRHSEKGLERVRTISEFCDLDNLPSSISIIEHELRVACGCATHNNWEEWFPDFDLVEPDRSGIIRDALDEIPRNRQQRRALKRIMSKPLSGGRERDFANEVIAKYPFMREGRRTLELWVSGRAEWNLVVEQLKTGLKDIVSFSEWLSKNWHHGAKFVDNLRAGNSSFKTTLTTLYQKMRELFENNPEARTKDNLELLRRIYIEQRDAMFTSFVAKNAPRMLEPSVEPTPSATLSPDKTPSLYTALSFLTAIAYKSAVPDRARNPDNLTGSDFVDAMHVLYLPLVHVFRADRFSCGVLNDSKPPRTAVLCPNLRDLPDLITDRHRALKSPL